MKQKVVIIGCGVIGAAIAYELSYTDLQVTVLETKPEPGKGATGASLGVLMAACSQTKNADLIKLRLASLLRYESLIPQLIAETNLEIPYNRAGILCLDDRPDVEDKWQLLIATREAQGFDLQYLDSVAMQRDYPQLQAEKGLYSISDRALNPTKLVQSLVKAAELHQVKFQYNCAISQISDLPEADWIVVTAGVGSDALLKQFNLIDTDSTLLTPVGGQAIRVHAPDLKLQPVVHAVDNNGEDINIVPLGKEQYWLGATVEFHPQELPRADNVAFLLAQAAKFCKALADAEVLETWAGYRPRPHQRRSPILGFIPNHKNILLATGHYRNGVLMAPVTASIIRDLITKGDSNLPWQKFALS